MEGPPLYIAVQMTRMRTAINKTDISLLLVPDGWMVVPAALNLSRSSVIKALTRSLFYLRSFRNLTLTWYRGVVIYRKRALTARWKMFYKFSQVSSRIQSADAALGQVSL